MKSEEQRIAIAEACGWTRIDQPVETKDAWGHCGYPDKKQWWFAYQLPDYPNDLNACHQMEKVLTDKQVGKYIKHLWGAMCQSKEAFIGTIHATAAQRCEAFLRTIGKWTEEKG